MRRVGVLTSGGDCPGLNAFLAALVADVAELPMRPVLIRSGFEGLVAAGNGADPDDVTVGAGSFDWVHLARLGGTAIGSARLNLSKGGRVKDAVRGCRRLDLDALVVVGGDGSLEGAARLAEHVPVVGVPKTIDNDVAATGTAIGFASAAQAGVDVVDRVVDTALSHRSGFVVEVMGRRSGFLAATIATAARVPVAVPEAGWSVASVAAHLRDGGVVVIAEGSWSDDLGPRPQVNGRNRVGGVAADLVAALAASFPAPPGGFRANVPGHVLRGGPPVAADRVLAARFAAAACTALDLGRSALCVVDAGQVTSVAFADAEPGRRFMTRADLAALGPLLLD